MKEGEWMQFYGFLEFVESQIEQYEEDYERVHEDLPGTTLAISYQKDKVKEFSEKRLENILENIDEGDFEASESSEFLRETSFGKIDYGLTTNKSVIRTGEDEWRFGSISNEYIGNVLGRLIFGYSLEEAIDEVYEGTSDLPEGAEIFLNQEGEVREEYEEDLIELAESELLEPSNDWYTREIDPIR